MAAGTTALRMAQSSPHPMPHAPCCPTPLKPAAFTNMRHQHSGSAENSANHVTGHCCGKKLEINTKQPNKLRPSGAWRLHVEQAADNTAEHMREHTWGTDTSLLLYWKSISKSMLPSTVVGELEGWGLFRGPLPSLCTLSLSPSLGSTVTSTLLMSGEAIKAACNNPVKLGSLLSQLHIH